MSGAHYLDKLYPLQDEVLGIFSKAQIRHYLTGGTAISRGYFNHRYSDDLDFFLNWDEKFGKETDRALDILRAHFNTIIVDSQQEHYCRTFIDKNNLRLKVDFVNDVTFHVNGFKALPLYYKVDNTNNILANKISALSRMAAKDLADIIWISRNCTFNWPEIIEQAKQKDDWVNETDVHEAIKTFKLEKLMNEVNWVSPPDSELLAQSVNRILKDIVAGQSNSLFV